MSFFLITIACIANVLPAATIKDEPGLAKHFEARKLEGTFVLLDPAKNTLHIQHRKRAETRFPPASTFKIPNALIGLDAGAVKNLDEVIPYGGTTSSNVPVFHQLAKRTGLERIRTKLGEFDYGNGEIGKDINKRFRLRGPLEISAVEQVVFLGKLAAGQLPVSAESMARVKSILVHSEKDGATLHAKTGWVMQPDHQVGWWVGWVESKTGDVFPFALNLAIQRDEDAQQRIPIALDCLASLGIY